MESGFSEVSVCNSGLLKVGADQISSLSDNTRASNVCQAMFPILRDEVMRACPWRFALTQRVLGVPNATAPAFGYSSAYDIPSDILRVWQVDVDQWTEVGNQILCDKPNGINTLAIYQNTDPTSWDAQFAEALAWRIAMEIALALVQSVPLKQEMEKGFEKSLALARSSNAVIGTPQRLIADFWSNARKFGPNRLGPINAGPPEPYGN
jgi:hypothetical protein